MAEISLFSIEMSGDTDTLARIKSGALQKSVFSKMAADASTAAANVAAKKMKKWLSKGHRFKVGATGEASESISVRSYPSVGAGASAEVVEEGDHNMFIRQGFRGTRRGREVPSEKIREWLGAKGITLTAIQKTKDGKTKFVKVGGKYVRQKAKGGKYYGRTLKKSIPQEDAFNALVAYMTKYGSRYSHWKSLYPKGSPRFDYVAYFMRNDQEYRNEIARIMEEEAAIYINWLTSGRKIIEDSGYSGERIFDSNNLI